METMGSYIKARRELLGMTQAELGDTVGIAKAYVSQIEIGKIAFPNADLRRRLADALGVRHIDLIVAAGELTYPEIPNAIPSALGPPSTAVQLCQKLEQIDLTADRRATTLAALLDMFLAQDRARTVPADADHAHLPSG